MKHPLVEAVNADCLLGCGYLGAASNFSKGLIVISEHFLAFHPEVTFIHQEHYRLYPAQIRCDACTDIVEPPFWTHIANPALEHRDDDGKWCLCEVCHGLWKQRRVDAWVVHALKVQMRLIPVLTQQERARIAYLMREQFLLLIERLDSGRLDYA